MGGSKGCKDGGTPRHPQSLTERFLKATLKLAAEKWRGKNAPVSLDCGDWRVSKHDSGFGLGKARYPPKELCTLILKVSYPKVEQSLRKELLEALERGGRKYVAGHWSLVVDQRVQWRHECTGKLLGSTDDAPGHLAEMSAEADRMLANAVRDLAQAVKDRQQAQPAPDVAGWTGKVVYDGRGAARVVYKHAAYDHVFELEQAVECILHKRDTVEEAALAKLHDEAMRTGSPLSLPWTARVVDRSAAGGKRKRQAVAEYVAPATDDCQVPVIVAGVKDALDYDRTRVVAPALKDATEMTAALQDIFDLVQLMARHGQHYAAKLQHPGGWRAANAEDVGRQREMRGLPSGEPRLGAPPPPPAVLRLGDAAGTSNDDDSDYSPDEEEEEEDYDEAGSSADDRSEFSD